MQEKDVVLVPSPSGLVHPQA